MATQLSLRSRAIPMVLGLALSAWSVKPATAATPSLKPLVVQSSDVTSTFVSGFKVLARRTMTTSDVGGLQTGTTTGGMTLLLKGWVPGFFSSFYRPTGGATSLKSGVSVVTSGVSLYKSSTYSRDAMDLTMKNKGTIVTQLRQAGATTANLARLNGVGDKAIIVTYSLSVGGVKTPPTSAYVILFSRGHLSATLSASGHGSVSKEAVLSVAHRIDGRLQHAG